MSQLSCKTLIIGIDAATFDLILPWVHQGKLPVFGRLLQQSSYGCLGTVPNLSSGSAWPSFMTGKKPANHGIIHFYEHQKGSYDIRYLNGSDIDGKSFWQLLSESGKRVGVINVPMTYPTRQVNGFMIAGLDAPSEKSNGFTYPPGLYKELVDNIGAYHIDTNIHGFARGGKWYKAVEVTEEVVKYRLDAALYLMKKHDCDLFTIVFTALDRVQHTFWKFMDQKHPDYNAQEAQEYGDVIYNFYAKIDAAVGNLLDQVDENTNILICSDHGAGFDPKSYLFLDPWLESLGLLTYAKVDVEHPLQLMKNILLKVFKQSAALVDRTFSKRVRKKLMSFFPGGRAKITQQLYWSELNWPKTKAFSEYALPHIWINLKGREPNGTISPGKEYENLCEYLIDKLRRCRDIRTKTPIVKNVFKKEEVYSGPYSFKAPDLLIEWNYETVVCGFEYEDDRGQIIQVTDTKDVLERKGISGEHRPEGIIVISGNNIKKGHKIEKANIIDIAPTVLYLFGEEIPEDMDGRVIEDAFEESFLKKNPIKYKKDIGEKRKKAEFSQDEAQQIEDRLKGLGYL